MYNDKRADGSERYNNYLYIFTKYWSSKIYEENIDNLEGRHTIIGNFNTPLSIMARTTRQKVNKDIQDLNNPTEQLNLANTYQALHPKTQYCTYSLGHLEHSPG